MSNFRDLQRLRNPKKKFQIKKSNPTPPLEIKINELRSNRIFNHNQEFLITPQLIQPRLIDFDPQFEQESFPIRATCSPKKDLRDRRTSDKCERANDKDGKQKLKQHKRGVSFGISNTFYESKSRQIPQSGLSVYNFSLKQGNTQHIVSHGIRSNLPGNISNKMQLVRKNNPLTSRKQKAPELLISHNIQTSDESTNLRQSKDLTRSNNSRRVRNSKDNPEQVPNFQSKNAFQIMYPIGKGGFGKVWKVRCKKTGQIFAMKEMQKAKVVNKKSINSVMNERTLLADLHHPFLVNIKSAFQDRQNLYLVMDYLNGGDLRYHIGCKGKFNQNQTKFFIANIIIGLEYLHSRKIIHRDLKPENFVLDCDGYLRITDLGVSRIVRDDNHTDTSGTPGYMAPQVICHKNHSFEADYFAVGIMGFQFMLGRRPYNGRNRKQIREQILTKQVEVKLDELPYKWSPKAADFINQLLQRNPEKRLGTHGIEDIKNHPWLADIDWRALKQKLAKSPFIPMSIEQNYDDYKEQISEDTVDENAEETRMILRDAEVQTLFNGYEFFQGKDEHFKKSLRSTSYTDSELRASGK